MDTKGIVVMLAIIVLIAAGIWYFGAGPGSIPAATTAPAEPTPAASTETPPSPVAP